MLALFRTLGAEPFRAMERWTLALDGRGTSCGCTIAAMTPPPNQPWGQNPFPQPTSTAWAPPPPPPTAALDNELQTWLVVTCIGWFVGFMWITGPLGWWKANDLRGKYAALGAPEPSNLNALRLIGIITTVMCIAGFVVACMGFVAFGLFAVGSAGAR